MEELIKILDEVMEQLLLDIETHNNRAEFFDSSKYRELYREYINQKEKLKNDERGNKS
jgi:hypothetical protein